MIRRHALRNALVPAVQGTALTLIYLTGGVVTIEYLFAYPGLGSALAGGRAGPRPPGRAGDRAALRGDLRRASTSSPTCSRPPRRRACGRRRDDRRPRGRRGSRVAAARSPSPAAPCARRARRVGLALTAARRRDRARSGPPFAPYDPARASASRSRSRPGDFLLGTDYLGHDVLSRVLLRRAHASSGWRSPRPRSASRSAPRSGSLAGTSRPWVDATADARHGPHPRVPADRARAALRLDARLEALAHRPRRRARLGAAGRARRPRRHRSRSRTASTSSRPSERPPAAARAAARDPPERDDAADASSTASG